MIRMWPLLVFLVVILGLGTLAYAKTSDEYLAEVYQLMDKKQYDEALALIEKGSQEHSGDLGLTIAFAETHHLKGDYEIAIANYVNIMKALASAGPEVPEMAHYHQNLADAYNELGQKHYFSRDLCLRIIYHTEKVLELMPEVSQDSQYIEFLRKSIGHYDMANLRPNVLMMEEGGDGAEFQLPDDYVNADEKMRYKDKATEKIKEFDASVKKNAFQTTTSDKTVEDLIQLVKQRISAIKTVHFKRINKTDKAPFEELIYKSPNKLKVIAPEAISIIIDQDYSVIDPKTNSISHQDKLDPTKLSLLKGMGFYNLNEASDGFNLTVEKINGCLDFLNEVCKDPSSNLYLVTGKLKTEDNGSYSPVSKIEYFIDGRSGICVARREYWPGVLGSGKEEQLVREDLITGIDQQADGVYLPSAGVTRGLVSELADLNQNWIGEIVTLNQEIDDETFNVSK